MPILKVANTFFDDSGLSRVQVSAANTIQLYTSDQERLRIDPDGNVGIGTVTTSSSMLNVSGDFSTTSISSGNIITTTLLPTTSGTQIDIANIPPWTKRILINFERCRAGINGCFLIQLGTSSGLETSAYYNASIAARGDKKLTDANTYFTGSSSLAEQIISSGFSIANASANNTIWGHMLLTSVNTNMWICSHNIWLDYDGLGGGPFTVYGAGKKTLTSGGGVLTRIALRQTYTGSSFGTFNLGNINVLYD